MVVASSNCAIIKQLSGTEDGHDEQRYMRRTGLLKVSIINNNRSRKSDPRLAWLMFNNIYQIYIYIREQESEEATELILNLHTNLTSNHTSSLSPITPKISIQRPKMNISPKTVAKYLKEI